MQNEKGKQKRYYLELKALIEDQVLEARDNQYKELFDDFDHFQRAHALRSNSLNETITTSPERKEKATKRYRSRIHFDKWLTGYSKIATNIFEYLTIKDFSKLSSTCRALRAIYIKADWEYFFDRDFESARYLVHSQNRALCKESYESLFQQSFIRRDAKKFIFHNVCCEESQTTKKLSLEMLVSSMRDVVTFKKTPSFTPKQLWTTKAEVGSAFFCLSLIKEYKRILLWQIKAATKTTLPTHRVYSQFGFDELSNVDELDCMFLNENRILVQLNPQNLKIYNIKKFNPLEFVVDVSTKHDISITADKSNIIVEAQVPSIQDQKSEERMKAIVNLRDQGLNILGEDKKENEDIQLKIEDLLKLETDNESVISFYLKSKNLIFAINTERENIKIIHLSLENGVYVKEFKAVSVGDGQISSGAISLLFVDSLSRMNKIVIDYLENKEKSFLSIKPEMIFDPFAKFPSQREKIVSRPTKFHEFFTHYPDEDYLISNEACLFLVDAEKAHFQLFNLTTQKSALVVFPLLCTGDGPTFESGCIRNFRIMNNRLVYFRGNIMLSAPLQASELKRENIIVLRASLETPLNPAHFVHIAKLTSGLCFIKVNSDGIQCELSPIGKLDLITKQTKSEMEERKELKKDPAKKPQSQENFLLSNRKESWERTFFRKRYALPAFARASTIDYKFPSYQPVGGIDDIIPQNPDPSLLSLSKIQNLVIEDGNKLIVRLPSGSFFVDFDLLVSRVESAPIKKTKEEELKPFLTNHKVFRPNTNHENSSRSLIAEFNEYAIGRYCTKARSKKEKDDANLEEEEKVYRTKTALKKTQKGLPKEKRKMFDPDYFSDDEKVKEKEDKFAVEVYWRDRLDYDNKHKTRVIKKSQKTGQYEKRLVKAGIIDPFYNGYGNGK